MQEGTVLLCNDNKHKVTVIKELTRQSFIVESTDKQLSFCRLMEQDDLYTKGIQFGSWIYLLKDR